MLQNPADIWKDVLKRSLTFSIASPRLIRPRKGAAAPRGEPFSWFMIGHPLRYLTSASFQYFPIHPKGGFPFSSLKLQCHPKTRAVRLLLSADLPSAFELNKPPYFEFTSTLCKGDNPSREFEIGIFEFFQIEESLERAEFTLSVELWFTDTSLVTDQQTNVTCVSLRTLQLSFLATKGLHYHLPVLFDYFHLSAITMTIHGSLVALHQPYIKWVE